MKQSVSPTVIVAVIAVVVVSILFFGIRALFPSSSGSNLSPSEYKSKMQQSTQAQHANMDKAKEHGPSGDHPGQSAYQEYIRRQQSGGH